MLARARLIAVCLALSACGMDELVGKDVEDPTLLSSPREAEDLDPDPDRVHVRLRATRATHQIGDIRYPGYAYDGRLPGPTVRGKIGDTLLVELENHLDQPTTIHWHGMQVPYAMDGVTWQADPVAAGARFTYSFELSRAGLFWYHPHFDAAGQVDRGLYGAVVVEAPDEPRVDHELVLVFDRWNEASPASGPGSSPHALGPPSRPRHAAETGNAGSFWTVNGKLRPKVELPAGERVRARLLNASTRSYLDLRFPEPVRQLAGDQGLLAQPVDSDAMLLAPGDRAEVELLLGDYDVVLSAAPYSELGGPAVGELEELAAIVTAGSAAAPASSPWPFSGAQASPDPPFSDIVYVFSGDSAGNDWRINGELFPDVTLKEVALGSDAVIEIRNASASEHPFHLHGHAFELLSVAGVAPDARTLEDTVNVRVGETVRVKLRADNPGEWMAHCHILEHAAAGMMTVLRVE